MTIKEKIGEMIDKWRNRNGRFKEMETDYSAQKKLQERQLSSDERELNGYLEQERKKKVKAMLEKFRKRDQHDFWHRDTISQKPLFNHEKLMLREKNLFLKQGDLF